MHAAVSQGKLEENQLGTFIWWIEPATPTRFGICVHEASSDRFLSWNEVRERITASGNVLAMVLADRVEPQMTNPAFCGRVTVPSLDELTGVSLEVFLRFIDTFISSTLRSCAN